MASKSSKRRKKRRRSRPADSSPSSGDGADGERGKPAGQPRDAPSTAASARRSAAAADQRPPAPWGSFPLIEIAILVGIILLVAGFFVSSDRSGAFILSGLALASIGGLELSIREHFAGYRSHTLLLAGVPAAIVLGLMFFLGPDGLPAIARAAIGAAVFAVGALLLTRAFRKRSGGLSFKSGGLRRR